MALGMAGRIHALLAGFGDQWDRSAEIGPAGLTPELKEQLGAESLDAFFAEDPEPAGFPNIVAPDDIPRLNEAIAARLSEIQGKTGHWSAEADRIRAKARQAAIERARLVKEENEKRKVLVRSRDAYSRLAADGRERLNTAGRELADLKKRILLQRSALTSMPSGRSPQSMSLRAEIRSLESAFKEKRARMDSLRGRLKEKIRRP